MGFFKRRAYQKSVLGWMRALLETGQGRYADAMWQADPSLKDSAKAFSDAGYPAITAAAELWRRIFTSQLLRARSEDRLAVYEYLVGKREEPPSKLAELCLAYCLELRKRGKVNDIDCGIADTYIDEVLQSALGRDSAERSNARVARKFDDLALGNISTETAEALRRGVAKD